MSPLPSPWVLKLKPRCELAPDTIENLNNKPHNEASHLQSCLNGAMVTLCTWNGEVRRPALAELTKKLSVTVPVMIPTARHFLSER